MTARIVPQIIRIATAAALASTIAFSAAPHAAPGTLATSPLFTATNVPPNIFFVLDDSGSMISNILKRPGARADHPEMPAIDLVPPLRSYALYLNERDASVQPTFPPWRDDHVLEMCAGYNALAYNPSVEYSPWAGKDSNGDDYTARALNDACTDPYYPSTCGVDLTGHFYFSWDDSVGAGEYQEGECPRPFFDGEITTTLYRLPATDAIDAAECATLTDCVCAGFTGGCQVPDAVQATNYANWYSYYRSRELVLKRVVSEIIDSSVERMGITTLHDSSNSLQGTYNNDCCLGSDRDTSPADCTRSPATPVTDMKTTVNKEYLLTSLFLSCSTTSALSTPLRQALDQAGKYFDATDTVGHENLDEPGNPAPSPIQPAAEGGACQRNYTVLVTDGFWNGPWPTDATSFGNEDSDGSISSVWDGGPHADANTETLADIAMHYYEKDLSRTLDDYVDIVEGVDENPQQHMVTYTVAFGVEGTFDPEDLYSLDRTTDTFDWGDGPVPGEQTTVDDLLHAAYNSRGQFLPAADTKEAVQQLKTAVAAIVALQQGSASSVGFNSGTLSDGSVVFQASFNTGDWSGNLVALEIDPTDGSVGDSAWAAADGSPIGAAELLDLKAWDQRFILTRSLVADGPTDRLDGVTFTWNNLTDAQKDDLRKGSIADGSPTQSAAAGEKRLDYLRGDRACEVGCEVDVDDDDSTADTLTLRTRGSRLADIVGSGPLMVGAPALGWPSAGPSPFLFPTSDGHTYAEFKTGSAASRRPVVYIGANDGMLHGFAASDGEELIAYVPSSLFSDDAWKGLHYLTDPNYAHRFYVDRTPAISDVYIATATSGTAAWRTVAVGALGTGGRGLYALDITEPNDFNATNAADIVLWEFSSADDAELEYTMSQPIIAPMNVTDANGLARWAAIVGSGYNDENEDGTGADQAHLFIIFLDGGVDGVWTEGTDYVKLEATVALLTEPNGLSSPAVADLNDDGTADRVYVGDLLGNLWTFDLRDDTVSEWLSVNLDPTPLFTATDGGSPAKPQPITSKPEISRHPSQGDTDDNWPNVMVYFGTGQFLTTTDHASRETQTFYGVWDNGASPRPLDRDHLQAQGFEAGFNYQVLEDNPVDWTDETNPELGWYIDLPDSLPASDLGERVVTDATIRRDIIFFNSMIPPAGSQLCTGGGSGFLYAVDKENGGRPDSPPYDTNADGIVDLSDMVTDGTDTQVAGRAAFSGVPTGSTFIGAGDGNPDTQYTSSIEGDGNRAVEGGVSISPGRLSWQQLNRQ